MAPIHLLSGLFLAPELSTQSALCGMKYAVRFGLAFSISNQFSFNSRCVALKLEENVTFCLSSSKCREKGKFVKVGAIDPFGGSYFPGPWEWDPDDSG